MSLLPPPPPCPDCSKPLQRTRHINTERHPWICQDCLAVFRPSEVTIPAAPQTALLDSRTVAGTYPHRIGLARCRVDYLRQHFPATAAIRGEPGDLIFHGDLDRLVLTMWPSPPSPRTTP